MLAKRGLSSWNAPRRGPDGMLLENADPVRIVYRDTGSEFRATDRTPFILLHGSPGDLSSFKELQPILARERRTIAIDLPGFGDSTRRIPDFSVNTQAYYLRDLLDHLGIARAHLVGFSMGGGVQLRLDALAGERIASHTLLNAIGIQEGEGSGDYDFEHLKYRIGWSLFVGVPEVVPHFGLLPSRRVGRPAMRIFMDSDQRPLREIIQSTPRPILVYHGTEDFLIPPWTAREHHRLAGRSELIMKEDHGHFMVFDEDMAAVMAGEIADFARRAEAGTAGDPKVEADAGWDDHLAMTGGTPADADADAGDGTHEDTHGVASRVNIQRTWSPWAQMTVIAGLTFVTEDGTCILSGLLARRGEIDIVVAILGCTIGIFVGDILLWLLGRVFGRRLLRWPWMRRKLPVKRLERFGSWIDQNAGKAIITSRFLPGMRLPVYVGAGMLGSHSLKFIMWFLIGALVWTPFIVTLVFAFGNVVVKPIENVLGRGWYTLLAAVIVLFILIRVFELSLTKLGRARLRAAVSRLWRWEFWPSALLYAPLIPYIAWLSFKNRGFTTVTAANPGVPHGGFVGEPKCEILSRLPQEHVLEACNIEPGAIDERMAVFQTAMRDLDLSMPVILKPDIGERGTGVRLVNDDDEARAVLDDQRERMIVQRFHAGPQEAGIFYVREPGRERGRIFAVTHKVFPEIVGDGTSTLRQLIWFHPRFRMQASRFLRRHDDVAEDVLGDGEVMRLAQAGNHCQGTMFLDGEHLISPELEAKIDAIARGFDGGFDFGRFDVRYETEEGLRRGEDFGIVELNGVTSEATNIYDPKRGLVAAWKTLAEQWRIVFAIGSANRAGGHEPVGHRKLLAMLWKHWRRPDDAIAD